MSLYITTPIFYVNAQPHLGHAYSTLVADTFCRFKRLCGEDVRFQTGTDEHGEKIARAAEAAGVSCKDYADRISLMFKNAWPVLALEPDHFIRTTDEAHVSTVQSILQKVHDQGDIYFGHYSGLYCRGCERFLTEKELAGGLCPDHNKAPDVFEEKNYFFRMSNYQDWLVDHIQSHPEFITPERYRNEVLSFLKEPLGDLCISRPVNRLSWGIPIPFDDRFVTYVWFDALINYLTGIGYPDDPDFARYWSSAEHIIAKDILKPHAIYWPTMLKAIGLAPYRRLHVHGYWNMGETKMSKSIGNVVGPAELAEEYGVDTVRYFLLREMTFGLDASFTKEALIARQNSDLANDLGNLFSRSLAMVKKFSAGLVPAPGPPAELDQELADAAIAMVAEFGSQVNAFAFNRALQTVWEVIGKANKYIVVNAPWELAKDAGQSQRLETVLYYLLETLRLVALTLQPVMPATAAKMTKALGVDQAADWNALGRWGLLPPGGGLHAAAPLFPRLDKKKNQAARENTAPANTAQPRELITFDTFKSLDLRVAEIVSAERIKKAKKLLKLTVRAPDERTVVAGIAEFYEPEDIIGKQVIIAANLQPVKLMGVTSHGMVLAARDGEQLALATVSAAVQAGSKIS